ncbi:MAG: exosortase A [Candidatus Brocadiaceae bacterium]|nr:exosortase A [Candidatus Brocadiaceae bacterium]
MPTTIKTNKQDESLMWHFHLFLLSITLLVTIIAFYHTAQSIVGIWYRSETFAHGFLIIPIVIWLIFEKRKTLALTSPSFDKTVFLIIPIISVIWLLSRLVGVAVVEQFAFVSIIILQIWALLGRDVFKIILFPVLFLFFSIPVGEDLVQPMIEFTADFTVGLLRLTGIPVFREGTFFSLPSGNWSVVEACSGVRYLIASVTLGVLYAYLTYQKLYKRIIFIAFSILIPIIANGLRAFLIVMIGHFSGMKLATGVDHIIYGWVFFGIVISIMFIIGAWWRDPIDTTNENTDKISPFKNAESNGKQILLTTIIIFVTISGPLSYASITALDKSVTKTLDIPIGRSNWKPTSTSYWSWRPHIVGASSEYFQFYEYNGKRIGLYVGNYSGNSSKGELVNSLNVLVSQDNHIWSIKDASKVNLSIDNEVFTGKQSVIKSRRDNLLVWQYYRVGDFYTSNNYIAKLLEAMLLITTLERNGSYIILSTDYEVSKESAINNLNDFILDIPHL